MDVSVKEAEEALLLDKECLRVILLHWSNYMKPVLWEDVLTSLRAHSNLSSLKIFGYWGFRIPSWVGDHSFSKLESLHLCSCARLDIFPSLGHLQSLKHLHIHDMSVLEVAKSKFCGDNSGKAFPSLITLEIVEMNSLEEWTGLNSGDMPCLRQLTIKQCPKLNALPSDGLPISLESLTISDCPQLVKRCKIEGEDWHKINNILKVEIDGVLQKYHAQ